MYYYLLEDDIPVSSMHKKQIGEQHYREISWSKIKQELTEEQFKQSMIVIETARKGKNVDVSPEMIRELGMQLIANLMIGAVKHKTEPKPRVSSASSNRSRRSVDEDEYDYKEVAIESGRSPEEERTRMLDINTRAILEGNKVAPLAETPKEFAKQIRKAMQMRSLAGIEIMLRAAERGLMGKDEEVCQTESSTSE